jgi:hypothetical protein
MSLEWQELMRKLIPNPTRVGALPRSLGRALVLKSHLANERKACLESLEARQMLSISPPTAIPDVYVADLSAPVSVSAANGLLANDTGAPGATLAVNNGTFSGVNGGSFALNADGSLSYTSTANAAQLGWDRASYSVRDNGNQTTNTSVTILSQPAAVVWKFYEAMLDRTAEDAGLTYWTAQIAKGQPLSQIAVAFFAGDELQTKVITDYYQQYLGRAPDPGGLSFWKAQWTAAGGPEDVQAGFANSGEFTQQNGNTPSGWVTGLYQKILNRPPESAGLSYWSDQVAQLDAQDGESFVADVAARFKVAERILKSQEEYQNVIVPGWYQQFVQRQPTSTELSNAVGQLLTGTPDRTVEEQIIDQAGTASDVPTATSGTGVSMPNFSYIPLLEWKTMSVQTDGQGLAYLLDPQGVLWASATPSSGLQQVANGVSALGTENGVAWALQKNTVLQVNGTNTTQWPSVLAADGSVWFMANSSAANGTFTKGSATGNIYQFAGGILSQVPGSAVSLIPGGGSVWWTDSSGNTYSWNGSSPVSIPQAITNAWQSAGGAGGTLGSPLGQSADVPTSYGQAVDFSGGTVYQAPSGSTSVVHALSGNELTLTRGEIPTPRISLNGNTINVAGSPNGNGVNYRNVVTVYRASGDLIDGVIVQLTVYPTSGLTLAGPLVYEQLFNVDAAQVSSVNLIQGSGDDAVTLPAGIATNGFKAVTISGLPTGNPQQGNTCGPYAAWHVLQAYGSNVTAQQIVQDTHENSFISANNLGTTADTLVGAMNDFQRGYNVPQFVYYNGQLQDILNSITAGKPVVAMIRVPGDQGVSLGGVNLYTVPQFHWIAIHGFDQNSQTIYYNDPQDGQESSTSFNDFVQSFDWNVGYLTNVALQGVGVYPDTYIA